MLILSQTFRRHILPPLVHLHLQLGQLVCLKELELDCEYSDELGWGLGELLMGIEPVSQQIRTAPCHADLYCYMRIGTGACGSVLLDAGLYCSMWLTFCIAPNGEHVT